MEIITTIFSYFWYELFFVLLGISLVYQSRMKFHAYKPHNISDSVPEDFETSIQSSEEAFYDLDWTCLGTFHCTHPKEQNVIIARFFCSPDYYHGAMYMTEFCTQLSPFGSILTNNNPYPESMVYPASRLIFKFPSIDYVNILHTYHLDFCQIAQSECFTLKRIEPESFEEFLYHISTRDYEYQVNRGRMKRVGDGVYSWTLRGAILAVPMQAIYLLYSFLFTFYRPKRKKMIKRLKRKLAKIKEQ